MITEGCTWDILRLYLGSQCTWTGHSHEKQPVFKWGLCHVAFISTAHRRPNSWPSSVAPKWPFPKRGTTAPPLAPHIPKLEIPRFPHQNCRSTGIPQWYISVTHTTLSAAVLASLFFSTGPRSSSNESSAKSENFPHTSGDMSQTFGRWEETAVCGGFLK